MAQTSLAEHGHVVEALASHHLDTSNNSGRWADWTISAMFG
jgi:hypothetical protein